MFVSLCSREKLRGEGVRADDGADARVAVGGDGHPDARTADEDPALELALERSPVREPVRVVGVVERARLGARAEVLDGRTSGSRSALEELRLQPEPTVVRPSAMLMRTAQPS